MAHWIFSYRVDITDNDIRNSMARFVSTIPSMEHGLRIINPGHLNRCSTLDHNDCIRIGLENLRDQLIRVRWQLHGGSIFTL
jgi:hypothetical protein